MDKRVILAIVILFILVFSIYQIFLKKEEPTFVLAEVSRGNISQEISETGIVKKGEAINLSFKDAGKIEKIYVEVGQRVSSGERLAKLETVQLSIQLQEAKAALEIAKAKLNKLLAGATPEEIQIAETAVSNAQTTLENANQNLKDTELLANENLDSAYGDALNILNDSYLEAYNALQTMNLITRTYFTSNDQSGITVRENKDKTEIAISQVKSYLDEAKADSKDREKTDNALSEMKETLATVYSSLGVIREISEGPDYRSVVSSTYKTSLDTHREYINTAITNITNSQQSISSTKLTNEANINSALAEVLSAEGALQSAKDELASLTAAPRQEDIDLYQAQVRQAEAQVNLLENQTHEAILRSPIEGQVTKINNREGELVQTTTKVISLIPEEPFQIEVDIPEVNIGKINLQNPCKITLDAFPEKEFLGQVIEIDPSETVMQGVVYYKIKVSINEQDSKIKPGMTANVNIISETRENVLIVPQRAVLEKKGKNFVRVPIDNDTFKEVEVQTGLRGTDGEIEIISGLKEGDEVITFVKEQ